MSKKKKNRKLSNSNYFNSKSKNKTNKLDIECPEGLNIYDSQDIDIVQMGMILYTYIITKNDEVQLKNYCSDVKKELTNLFSTKLDSLDIICILLKTIFPLTITRMIFISTFLHILNFDNYNLRTEISEVDIKNKLLTFFNNKLDLISQRVDLSLIYTEIIKDLHLDNTSVTERKSDISVFILILLNAITRRKDKGFSFITKETIDNVLLTTPIISSSDITITTKNYEKINTNIDIEKETTNLNIEKETDSDEIIYKPEDLYIPNSDKCNKIFNIKFKRMKNAAQFNNKNIINKSIEFLSDFIQNKQLEFIEFSSIVFDKYKKTTVTNYTNRLLEGIGAIEFIEIYKYLVNNPAPSYKDMADTLFEKFKILKIMKNGRLQTIITHMYRLFRYVYICHLSHKEQIVKIKMCSVKL